MPSSALEIHRNRGFDCLCGNMRMAARSVTTLYDGYLAPAGLTAAELSVLWCVVSAQPVSMQKISEFLAMEKSTVTRNVAHLCARNLLTRQTPARLPQTIFQQFAPNWPQSKRTMPGAWRRSKRA